MPVNDKKRAYGVKLASYIDDYKTALIVTCDNVGSRQMQQIRISLRGKAQVIMGKNVRGRARSAGSRHRVPCAPPPAVRSPPPPTPPPPSPPRRPPSAR